MEPGFVSPLLLATRSAPRIDGLVEANAQDFCSSRISARGQNNQTQGSRDFIVEQWRRASEPFSERDLPDRNLLEFHVVQRLSCSQASGADQVSYGSKLRFQSPRSVSCFRMSHGFFRPLRIGARVSQSVNEDSRTGSPMPCRMSQLITSRPREKTAVTQHTIHILVDDEAGILTRVVGLFSRRGYNIDSLAVGLTNKRALITMVVPGDATTIDYLSRQLMKLVNVLSVQDITYLPKVQRELMLLKVQATAETRTEILEVAEIFRARVVEITDEFVTIEATGKPDKTAAIERILAKHTIREIARTGRICLLRENTIDTFARRNGANLLFDAETLSPNSPPTPSLPLEHFQSAVKEKTLAKLHTLSVLVQDVPGILVRVTSLFSRRGYNIESLAVGTAEGRGLSRITVVVPGDEKSVEQMKRQINKLIHVLRIEDITDVPIIQRELMLIKLNVGPTQRTEVLQIAKVYRARILDVGYETITLEVTGDPGKMAAIQQMLKKFGIREIARTGKVALVRESRINTTFINEGRSAPYVAEPVQYP